MQCNCNVSKELQRKVYSGSGSKLETPQSGHGSPPPTKPKPPRLSTEMVAASKQQWGPSKVQAASSEEKYGASMGPFLNQDLNAYVVKQLEAPASPAPET